MTAPLPDRSPHGISSEAQSHERVKLARKWAAAVESASHIPLPYADFQRNLEGLLDELLGVLLSEPFTPDRATDTGAHLVTLGCTGPDSLQSTMDTLGRGLLTVVPDHADRVLRVLGHLAAGYSEAVRETTMSQQETMGRALLKALHDARGDLRTAQARFDHVVTGSASGIALAERDGRLTGANDRLSEILGYSVDELAAITLVSVVHPEDGARLRHAYQTLLDGRARRINQEYRLIRQNGDSVWTTVTLSLPQPEDEDGQIVTVIEDATELNLLQSQLTHQSLHDMQTRLPNRQFFTTNLERVLRDADHVTLYHLDLDAFFLITHGLGRRAGETLLTSVAQRLQNVFAREKAMVARVGADEFAVLVENSPSTPDAVSTIRLINRELAQPIYVDGQGISASASIGVVDRPRRNMGATQLLDAAELTLARAKRDGYSRWALFDPLQEARHRASFALAAALPGAWETGRVQVVHQQLLRLTDGRPVGADALLSWDDARRGTLTHTECADLAEQTGVIIPIGRWLLTSAATHLQHARWDGQPELPVHISLTASQAANPDLVDQVLDVLADTGLPPGLLRLGMPSATLAARAGEAADNLELLANAGVGIEIRDFTASWGDLSYLEDFPVDAVRVSPWPIERQARHTTHGALITRALRDTLAIVHDSGATVIIDGIDTPDQATWWRELGADAAWGSF